jgi:hypothetical protein
MPRWWAKAMFGCGNMQKGAVSVAIDTLEFLRVHHL